MYIKTQLKPRSLSRLKFARTFLGCSLHCLLHAINHVLDIAFGWNAPVIVARRRLADIAGNLYKNKDSITHNQGRSDFLHFRVFYVPRHTFFPLPSASALVVRATVSSVLEAARA